MEDKIYYSGKELKQLIKTAIDTLAEPVKSTLGPFGNNVFINKDRKYYITKDGVSVAKSVYSNNIAENIIISFIKDIAEKTNKEVGDGTSTSIVLAQAIYNNIQSSTLLLSELQKYLTVERDKILKYIDKYKKVDNIPNMSYNVSLISTNGNQKMSKLISEAYESGDNKGIIDIQESPTGLSYIDEIAGYTLNAGAISENFINENKQKFISENAACLLIDGKLLDIKSVTTTLEYSLRINKDLLIIAEDFGEDVLKILERNNYKNTTKFIPVKIPGIRYEKKELLKDISYYINSDILSSINTKNVVVEVDKIIVNRNSTTIQKKDNLGAKRIEQLNQQLLGSVDEFKIFKLKERIKTLEGKLSIIYVGGNSELEIKELMDRVEDAVNAVKAALEGGILLGRGVVLRNIANKYYKNDKIMFNILTTPYKSIYKNANIEVSTDYSEKIALNPITNKKFNLYKENIIDPVNVVKAAIKNAFSIVSMLISTNYLIVDNNSWSNL